jgi:hypothetical protein
VIEADSVSIVDVFDGTETVAGERDVVDRRAVRAFDCNAARLAVRIVFGRPDHAIAIPLLDDPSRRVDLKGVPDVAGADRTGGRVVFEVDGQAVVPAATQREAGGTELELLARGHAVDEARRPDAATHRVVGELGTTERLLDPGESTAHARTRPARRDRRVVMIDE